MSGRDRGSALQGLTVLQHSSRITKQAMCACGIYQHVLVSWSQGLHLPGILLRLKAFRHVKTSEDDEKLGI